MTTTNPHTDPRERELWFSSYRVTAYNADMESLSVREHHLPDTDEARTAYYAEGHEVGPFTAGEALAFVAEAGRVGRRTDDDGNRIIEPVAFYRTWYSQCDRATGHYETYDAPKTSAHSTCTHANTKADRARCRAAAKKEN
jgi:hypothetical protein